MPQKIDRPAALDPKKRSGPSFIEHVQQGLAQKREAPARGIGFNPGELARWCAAYGRSPQEVDSSGRTALMHAAADGNAPWVEALLEVCDPLAADRNGETALMHAAKARSLECVLALWPVSDPRQENHDEKTALRLLFERVAPSKSFAKELIEALAALPATTPLGHDDWAPAAVAAYEQDDLASAEALFAVCDINKIRLPGPRRCPLLSAATTNGRVEDVEFLIKMGADANAQEADGSTALMLALREREGDCVRFLTALTDMRLQNAEGDTALHIAADGYSSVIAALVAAGARADLKNLAGETALHRAVRVAAEEKRWPKELLGLLVSVGDIRQRDADGRAVADIAIQWRGIDGLDAVMAQMTPKEAEETMAKMLAAWMPNAGRLLEARALEREVDTVREKALAENVDRPTATPKAQARRM